MRISHAMKLACSSLIVMGCADYTTAPQTRSNAVSALVVEGEALPGDTVLAMVIRGLDARVGYFATPYERAEAYADSVSVGNLGAFVNGLPYGDQSTLSGADAGGELAGHVAEVRPSLISGDLGLQPAKIYRGVESLAGYVAGEMDGGGGSAGPGCRDWLAAVRASDNALSRMNREAERRSIIDRRDVAVAGAAEALGQGIMGGTVNVGSFGAIYLLGRNIYEASFLADFATATFQNAFVKAVAKNNGCM
jgi:hypothetical protein